MSEATATAVAEPVASPETEAQHPVESEAPAAIAAEGTGQEATVQVETTTETPATETPVETEPERLRREAHEADLKVAEEAAYERAQRELREERQTARQRVSFDSFRTSHANATRQLYNVASQLTIVDTAGEQRNLTPNEIESLFIAPVKASHDFVVTTREADMNTPIAQAAERTLKKDVFEKFAEKASGKSPDEWLTEYAEHKWDDTKGAKGMTLEDAEGISPKVKRDTTKLRADLAEANDKVKKLTEKYGPEGDPLKNGNTRSGGGQLSYSDLTKMNKAQLSKLPDEEFQAAMARR